ncbi:30S ribosomal protein S3 [Candidatus Dojkabacteria bacterium]|uniref:Small ribosomal subunit protein uS3 n=1 Tax=Candidatus Dojkabacteria bacterium TaxID=2099670 RepID=A0A955L2D6_9BACT|nr:30S ribosomal protein S3 [Candidatus Dojkabacteria bacterium]
MARGAHKVHPTGFRLGINKSWKSRWYADKSTYADKFLNDKKLRDAINKNLKHAGVASTIIKRSINKVIIEIHVARPGVVIGKGGSAISDLKKDLEKIAGTEVEPKIFEVRNPEAVAKLVAENIAFQCERRINPKVAGEKAVQAAMENRDVKGITVWIGGRIRGAEMARVEKISKGVVPRHTLRNDVDYAFTEAQVPGAGKHGIKVWINKGEKQGYDID